MRLAIAGYPKAGKTTAYPDAMHTDDVADLPWGEDSEVVALWFDSDDPDLVVEGVAVPRALRKLKRAGRPCPIDKLIFMMTPRLELNSRQKAMGEAQRAIVADELASWIPKIEWHR